MTNSTDPYLRLRPQAATEADEICRCEHVDAKAEAGAVAVLDFQMPGANPVYRALPVDSLFGELAAKGRP